MYEHYFARNLIEIKILTTHDNVVHTHTHTHTLQYKARSMVLSIIQLAGDNRHAFRSLDNECDITILMGMNLYIIFIIKIFK